MHRSALLAGLALMLLVGCTTPAQRIPNASSVEPVPALSVRPPAPVLTQEVAATVNDPMPVYHSPKVVKVVVAPYINAKGEAFPETYKYVFADEGGWNIDALRSPDRAYIPAENVLKPKNAPGVLWSSLSPGAAPQAPAAEAQGLTARRLFDIDQLHITGFFNRSDESKAKREAEKLSEKFGPLATSFDEDLGWILIPQAALNPLAAPQEAKDLSSASPADLPARRADAGGK